jgi:predicted nucleic acid-binding protein
VKMFFDSSAFAKRYIDEAGSDVVEKCCLEATDLALCIICVPEILSALNRRVRERAISKTDYGRLKRHLLEDVRDATIVNLTPDVMAQAVKALERSPLRAADAMHIAAAEEWGADMFVSADQRQLSAARAVGLRTKSA